MSTNKLPEWPEELPQPCGLGDVISYYKGAYDAALARLREAKEWLKQVEHPNGCDGRVWDCTCGLDEFLADMLPEGEEE